MSEPLIDNRSRRASIATETLSILSAGGYQAPSGRHVDLADAIVTCVEGARFYDPDTLTQLCHSVEARTAPYTEMHCTVTAETTLAAAQRLLGRHSRVAALNFASAKHPGGGFLGGSQAQEESLARASALYPSLTRFQAPFYDFHQRKTLLYSDRAIVSPDCPVFRDDNDHLLETPYAVTFITAAAPNAGAIAQHEAESLSAVPTALAGRAAKVLALAADADIPALVLGAWGCGVFRNDPLLVANVFRQLLAPGAPYHGRFAKVCFAIHDRSKERTVFRAFEETLTSRP
ncbi:TIGR02452 family protein [Chitinimonas lacunae]|uniref:TIGR02452 family protein n=1 Tax=Chitinimonas lacunae TaxID=1963018 RepID=A0ABV8MJR1_9NEIS